MGRKSDIIKKARQYVGYDYQHFCGEFGGGCWAWCAAFISTIAKESGNDDIIPRSTSCNEQIRVFKERGMWLGTTTDIQPGDIIYYDWDRIAESRPADHVGIVVEVNGNNVKVIEGNKGNADNDETVVDFRNITKAYGFIFGIARPKYSDNNAPAPVTDKTVNVTVRQLSRGCMGRDVEAMQAILIAKGFSCGTAATDGDFGKDTEYGLISFQQEENKKDKNFDVDGICGIQTWSALLRR